MSEWKPKPGDTYYWINDIFEVIEAEYADNFLEDSKRVEAGNYFKTYDEAAEVVEKLKALIKDQRENKKRPKLTVEIFDREYCPDWAKWAAVDADGDAYFYEKEPVLSMDAGYHTFYENSDFLSIPGIYDNTDWEYSLIKRPERREENKMKVIALDMDGVVNSRKKIIEWLDAKKNHFVSLGNNMAQAEDKTRKAYMDQFQDMTELVFPEYATRVSKIINETGAKILWSSTWRNIDKYKDLEVAKDMFNRRGLPGEALIDRTPNFLADFSQSCDRGHEISHWLKEHPEVTKCAVIDDREDAGYGLPANAQYFATTWESGLTDDTVDAIIKYLNED